MGGRNHTDSHHQGKFGVRRPGLWQDIAVMKGFPAHATRHLPIDSPIGGLVLLASDDGLAGLFFAHRVSGRAGLLPPRCDDDPLLAEAALQLDAYFGGRLESFDLAIDPRGTGFQRRVWRELSRIPFGQTTSYGEIARRIGNAKAVRAVGLANGANPISIIVPCHRVIGADGSLTGFGGGLEIKRRLLEMESAA